MKYIKKYKKTLVISFCVLAIVIVGAILINTGNTISQENAVSTGKSTANSDAIVHDEKVSTANNSDNDGVIRGEMSAYIPPLSTDELIEQSTLVVYGRIKRAETVLIEAVVDKVVGTFTDYYFEPISILRGTPINKESVLVRIQGGESKDHGYVNGFIDPLDIGEEYLMFLYRPEQGSGFEVKDDHYYVQGLEQGVFKVSGNKTIQSKSGAVVPKEFTAISDDNIESNLNFETFEAKIAKANVDIPVDKYLIKNETLENFKANLNSGFITKEEYNDYLSDMDKYAVIVERHDVKSPKTDN